MGNFITDLLGGLKPVTNNKKNFNLYCQFDNDEPIKLINNIENSKSVIIELVNTNDDHSYIHITCNKTKKSFKMYVK